MQHFNIITDFSHYIFQGFLVCLFVYWFQWLPQSLQFTVSESALKLYRLNSSSIQKCYPFHPFKVLLLHTLHLLMFQANNALLITLLSLVISQSNTTLLSHTSFVLLLINILHMCCISICYRPSNILYTYYSM